MSVLQVLALLAVKWALTLPVIVVKTEVATSYLMLAAAAALFALAIYYDFHVETTFGRRLVWWCAGTSGLVLVLALWGFANTLLARRVGRWSSDVGGSSVACTDSCFGASRLASLSVSLLAAISLLVVAYACTSRPDSILRRVESGVTNDELQQLLYEWQLLNCRASEAAVTGERLGAMPSSSRAFILQEGRNGSFDEGVAWVGSWSDIMVADGSEIQNNALADSAAGNGAVLSCGVHQLSWGTPGMRPAVQSLLVADVWRVCVLSAVVLVVRLLSIGLMIYHADSPAWTVIMDGKRHHLHPYQAIEQVRDSWIQFQRQSQRIVIFHSVQHRDAVRCACLRAGTRGTGQIGRNGISRRPVSIDGRIAVYSSDCRIASQCAWPTWWPACSTENAHAKAHSVLAR